MVADAHKLEVAIVGLQHGRGTVVEVSIPLLAPPQRLLRPLALGYLPSERFVRTGEIGGTLMDFALEFILRFSLLLMDRIELGDVLKNTNQRNHLTIGIAADAFYGVERTGHAVHHVHFFDCPPLA